MGLDCSIRADHWPHGGEPGTKHLSCIEEMASGNRNGMDGQHGGPVLDAESRKSWKVFVANRVRKMAQITEELGIQWKYCLTERNLADIGSRGASLKKMENCEWYEGSQWLPRKEDWPEQPSISCSSKSQEEERRVKEIVAYTNKQKKRRMGRAASTQTVLEGSENNNMGPRVQRQHLVEVPEGEEGLRTIAHRRA